MEKANEGWEIYYESKHCYLRFFAGHRHIQGMGMIMVDVMVMVMVMIEVLVIGKYEWENIEGGKSTENQGGKNTGFPRE